MANRRQSGGVLLLRMLDFLFFSFFGLERVLEVVLTGYEQMSYLSQAKNQMLRGAAWYDISHTPFTFNI